MNLQAMILMCRNRTKVLNNDPMIIDELNASADEFWKRLYAVCPDVQLTFDTEGTFAADTQQFDLGAAITAVGGTFYGSKTFYIKGASDNRFIPVEFMDTNDPRFQGQFQEQAQVIQPVYASVVNFSKIEFAPAMPSGTMWRADWIGKPPNLSLATNTQTSIPDPADQAIVDDACASLFETLDDDRAMSFRVRSDYKRTSAINVIKSRQAQTPFRTRGYPPMGGQSGFSGNYPTSS